MSVSRTVLREQVKELLLERILSGEVKASGNRTLLEVWTSLRIDARTIMTLLATGVDRTKLADMHEPILDALRSGDPDLAGRTVRAHVEGFRDLLLEGAHS